MFGSNSLGTDVQPVTPPEGYTPPQTTTSNTSHGPTLSELWTNPYFTPVYGAAIGGLVGHKYGNTLRGVGAGTVLGGVGAVYRLGDTRTRQSLVTPSRFNLAILGLGGAGAYVGYKYFDSPVIGGTVGLLAPLAFLWAGMSGMAGR
jgi:hypothetical protein